MKNKKRIKVELLDQFRMLSDDMDCELPRNWLFREYLPRLNGLEKREFDRAISDLTKKGIIIQTNEAIPTFKLTERGVSLIC